MAVDVREPVGVVGAGVMGLPVIEHLVAGGFDVVCYDRDPARVDAAVAAGASAAASLREMAASCSTALIFVPTDADVTAVSVEYIASARRGTTFVVCSSALPSTCVAIGAAAKERGVRVLDAALTGGIRGATDGTINLLAGGSADDLAHVSPVLQPWTRTIHHLGVLGMGQVGKTVNNLIHWGQIVVLSEALSIGARLGVPVSQMRKALMDGTVDSRTLRELENMRFTWFEKDIDNALVMAQGESLDIPVGRFMQRCMRRVTVPGMADLLSDNGTIEFEAG